MITIILQRKQNIKNNITNDITRRNHNNYEHNVIKKVHKHIKHINNYDTEINQHSKKSLDKNNYYNLYNDNFDFRKIENVSLSQQTDITNNITETNTQTINYVGNNYLNNDKIATITVNPTPSLTENYLWIPEGITDNVVPCLDSSLTYIQSKYATLTALQNSITNINTTIHNEIEQLQSEINNIEISNPTTMNVSKNLSFHTGHTGFMYQRNTTNNDNRRQIVIQNHYFTYQRKGNHELELMIPTLQQQVNEMEIQMNNLGSDSSAGNGGEIGVSWGFYSEQMMHIRCNKTIYGNKQQCLLITKKENYNIYIYIYIYIAQLMMTYTLEAPHRNYAKE